jgi:hypothetical protein
MAMMAKVLIPAHGRSRRSSRNRLRDLAVFDLAIDSKLRGCNVVALKVVNVAPNGYAGRSSIHSPAQNRKASSLRDRGANAPSNRRISPPTGRRVQSIPVFRKRSGRSFDHAEYARLLAECLTMSALILASTARIHFVGPKQPSSTKRRGIFASFNSCSATRR